MDPLTDLLMSKYGLTQDQAVALGQRISAGLKSNGQPYTAYGPDLSSEAKAPIPEDQSLKAVRQHRLDYYRATLQRAAKGPLNAEDQAYLARVYAIQQEAGKAAAVDARLRAMHRPDRTAALSASVESAKNSINNYIDQRRLAATAGGIVGGITDQLQGFAPPLRAVGILPPLPTPGQELAQKLAGATSYLPAAAGLGNGEK